MQKKNPDVTKCLWCLEAFAFVATALRILYYYDFALIYCLLFNFIPWVSALIICNLVYYTWPPHLLP